MKEYRIGYISEGQVLEKKAILDLGLDTISNPVKEFFNNIENLNIEDYFYSFDIDEKLLCSDKVPDSEITNMEELKQELRTILKSEVIDFSKISKLFNSGSKLNNPMLKEVLEEFLKLFEFETICKYKACEFNGVYRFSMLCGSKEDSDYFQKFTESLVGNTTLIKFVDINSISAKKKVSEQLTKQKTNSRI